MQDFFAELVRLVDFKYIAALQKRRLAWMSGVF